MGNVVPNYAEVVCEIRIANPEINEAFIEKEILSVAEEIGVKADEIKFKFYLGAMLTQKNYLINLEESIKAIGEEVIYADISLAGYYEVQMLQEAWGSRSVVFGAGPINLSHSANEYLDLTSLGKTESIVRNLVQKIIAT